MTLVDEVKNWGTPRASDAKGSGLFGGQTHQRDHDRQYLRAEVLSAEGGSLNPDWEDLLMGWPLGWSDATKPCSGVFPGYPAGQGDFQFDYEPPRTVDPKKSPNRAARVRMLGNGVEYFSAVAAFTKLLRITTGVNHER